MMKLELRSVNSMPDSDNIAPPARAYIDALPPELIRRIFIWTKAYEAANRSDPSTSTYLSPLYMDPPLSVFRSHVSRRWREIALSCPELWNEWPRYGQMEPWTEVCYARSLRVPLNLSIIIDDSESTTAGRKLALDEISRAQTLLVKFDWARGSANQSTTNVFIDMFEAMSRRDAPWLESLVLDNDLTEPPTLIPLPLFQNKPPPLLHTAFINGFELQSSNKIWSGSLCVLEMRNACAWRNVDEMIEFFKSVPNLEELTYQYDDTHGGRAAYLIDFKPSVKHSIRCVPLKRLKRFYLLNDEDERLWGGFVPGISMFSYLALPETVILDMRADMIDKELWERRDDDVADAHTLDGPVADNFVLGTQALRVHFADAEAKGQSYDVVTIRDRVIRTDLTRQVTDSSTLPSALTLVLPHVDIQGRNGRVSRMACSMYLSIPVFQGTTHLEVTRTRESRPFLHRFPTFPSVRILTLARKAVKDFVEPPRFFTYAERFPASEIIRFTDFDCDETVQPVFPPGPRPNSYELLDFDVALIDTLIKCDEGGLCKTWKRVEFVGCAHGEGVVRRIREDVRLRRFNEQVLVVCEDGGGYEGHGGSDRSRSSVSAHSDEE